MFRRRINYWLIMGLSLTGVFVSCNKNQTSPRQQLINSQLPLGQYNSDEQINAQRNYNNATRQFRVFDPTFDLNPLDNISTAEMNQRFPIHLNGTSQVAWLADGEDFFAARMNLLNRAQRSVRIQSLIFENDESSRVVGNKLIELVNRGISVKVIVDPIVNYKPKDQELYFELQRNGVMIEGYEVFYLNYVSGTQQIGDLGLTVGEANMRYHEKYFIVDGELPTGMAIMGGVNLGNNYFKAEANNPENTWVDRDVLLKGPVVLDMVRAFEMNYQEFYNQRVSGMFGDTSRYWDWANLLLGKKGPLSLAGMNTTTIQRLNTFSQKPLPSQWIGADIRLLQSRPRAKEDLIHPALIEMISRSQSEILINNSYFLPDDQFKIAIKDAINRGVKIKILTNHMENTDFPQLQRLARSEYWQFLEMNPSTANEDRLEIYEWGGHPILQNGLGQNHSKFAVFDRKAVMIGSYNIDPRSRSLNSESVVVFENPTAVQPYVDEFHRQIQPTMAQKVHLLQARSFTAPGGLREQFELKMAEILRPLL